MAEALEISRDESIGIHAMALLAGSSGEPRTARDMASQLGVSSRRLSRVLLVLAEAGYLAPAGTGNPGKAFVLSDLGRRATVLEVLESMGGPVTLGGQPLRIKALPGAEPSPLEQVLECAHKRVIDLLGASKLADSG
jgi:DNA-binding IscR family transcriptional regulator